MARRGGKVGARRRGAVLELVQFGDDEQPFIDRRSANPRRVQNLGREKDRRKRAADRRSGDEQRMFARRGFVPPNVAAAAAAVGGAVARPDPNAIAAMQRQLRQLNRYPGQMPTDIPPDQLVGADFRSWGVGEKAQPGPDARGVVQHVRDRAQANQRILIEAGNGQYARVRTPVTVHVRVINGLGTGVRGARVRVPAADGPEIHETDEHGLLQISWNILATGAQTLVAELLDPTDRGGNPSVVDSVPFTAFGL